MKGVQQDQLYLAEAPVCDLHDEFTANDKCR